MWGLSWSDVKAFADIVLFVAVLIWGGFMWRMRGIFVTHGVLKSYAARHEEEHTDIETRLAAGERDFRDIRDKLSHLASSDQVFNIQLDVTKVEGEIRRLDTKIDGHEQVSRGNTALLNTIHQHLLNERNQK